MKRKIAIHFLCLLFLCTTIPLHAEFNISLFPTSIRETLAVRFSTLFRWVPPVVRSYTPSFSTTASFFGGLSIGGAWYWWQKRQWQVDKTNLENDKKSALEEKDKVVKELLGSNNARMKLKKENIQLYAQIKSFKGGSKGLNQRYKKLYHEHALFKKKSFILPNIIKISWVYNHFAKNKKFFTSYDHNCITFDKKSEHAALNNKLANLIDRAEKILTKKATPGEGILNYAEVLKSFKESSPESLLAEIKNQKNSVSIDAVLYKIDRALTMLTDTVSANGNPSILSNEDQKESEEAISTDPQTLLSEYSCLLDDILENIEEKKDAIVSTMQCVQKNEVEPKENLMESCVDLLLLVQPDQKTVESDNNFRSKVGAKSMMQLEQLQKCIAYWQQLKQKADYIQEQFDYQTHKKQSDTLNNNDGLFEINSPIVCSEKKEVLVPGNCYGNYTVSCEFHHRPIVDTFESYDARNGVIVEMVYHGTFSNSSQFGGPCGKKDALSTSVKYNTWMLHEHGKKIADKHKKPVVLIAVDWQCDGSSGPLSSWVRQEAGKIAADYMKELNFASSATENSASITVDYSKKNQYLTMLKAAPKCMIRQQSHSHGNGPSLCAADKFYQDTKRKVDSVIAIAPPRGYDTEPLARSGYEAVNNYLVLVSKRDATQVLGTMADNWGFSVERKPRLHDNVRVVTMLHDQYAPNHMNIKFSTLALSDLEQSAFDYKQHKDLQADIERATGRILGFGIRHLLSEDSDTDAKNEKDISEKNLTAYANLYGDMSTKGDGIGLRFITSPLNEALSPDYKRDATDKTKEKEEDLNNKVLKLVFSRQRTQHHRSKSASGINYHELVTNQVDAFSKFSDSSPRTVVYNKKKLNNVAVFDSYTSLDNGNNEGSSLINID